MYCDYRKTVLNRVLDFFSTCKYSSYSNLCIICLRPYYNHDIEEQQLNQCIIDGYIEKVKNVTYDGVVGPENVYQLSAKGRRAILNKISIRELWLRYVYPNWSNDLIRNAKKILDRGDKIIKP